MPVLGGSRRSFSAALATVAAVLGALTPALPASAHQLIGTPPDKDVTAHPIGPVAPTVASAAVGHAAFAAPQPGAPQQATFEATLTRNPDTPAFFEAGFTTPAETCAAPLCNELTVDVPQPSTPGAKRTLYARVAWARATDYVHLWGIAPDGSVVGKAQVSNDDDKTTGNERTIPVAELTVADPQPGTWRIQTRAVFGHEIPVTGMVALAAGPPVELPRIDTRTLADRHLTQQLTFNIVFAGRHWSREEIATFRDNLPPEYRLAVHGKQSPDCGTLADNGIFTLDAWGVCQYSGTDGEGATGARPYFEPVKFTFTPRFLEADEHWTRDLFGAMKRATTPGEAFAGSEGNYLSQYDAQQGRANRGPDAAVANPNVGDKVDAVTVEDWVFDHRLDGAYRQSFTDLDTGAKVSGSFITPTPTAYFDPFYTAKGHKDLETMPQGPTTSLTFFVLDTFSDAKLTGDYFRRDAYHFFDVSRVMVDPDTGKEQGPDFARVWGGRYHFFLHDLGAGPNDYEKANSFTGKVAGSAAYPNGDPPIWDYDHDARWAGKLAERTARDAATMLQYRLVAPFVFRPIPADVYLLAANNVNDCYANPRCSPDGISRTDLTKVYKPDYVERNFSAAIPAATFITERSDPHLRTYRDLGCAKERAVTNPNPAVTGGGVVVLAPDPNCVGKTSDPLQEAIERAKARGDDLVGPGVNDFGVSGYVVRAYVEEHRDEMAPQPAGQFTIASISAVFPGSGIWFVPIPGSAGGVGLTTPNGEAWGILQSLNEVSKPATATICGDSSPLAPGCGITPPDPQQGYGGFSYVLQHEASHFLGLHHPHDSLVVEKDAQGKWQRYGYSYRFYGDFSQAPTSYAGTFAPYSVLDQDVLQRGHTAEYLQHVQDRLADAYLLDGAAGRPGPSEATSAKVREATRWRDVASGLFACGDYLHAERAMRNADLAAQGVFGPVVAARPLSPGEQVLFEVRGQRSYDPDGGALSQCNAVLAAAGQANDAANRAASRRAGGSLPATGSTSTAPLLASLLLASVALGLHRLRKPGHQVAGT
jgi:hypothetical protein